MKASLPLLCLLVAAASARYASPAQATPQMVRRSMKVVPRLLDGAGDGTSNTTDTGSNDGSGSTSSSSNPSLFTFTSAQTTLSTSSSSNTVPTTSSTSSSHRQPTTTSYQSTVTASNSLSSTTDALGSTVVVTYTLSASSSTTTAASATSTASSSSSSGSHTGLIVGVSVVGGVAILGVLIFLWMKFGGKRFSDYQDEDADIKWPELKADGDSAAMQPLPARRTGGSGFDMGNEFEDQHDIDGQSMAEYGNTGRESMTGSTTALNAGVGAGIASYAAPGSAAYGSGMEKGGAYHDESPGISAHYAQPAVAGYYDPYGGTYASSQPQGYYPEPTLEGVVPPQHQQYEDYSNYQSDPYAAARAQASSTSPHMQPYRVNSQSMHHPEY